MLLSAGLFVFCVGSSMNGIWGAFNITPEILEALQRFDLTYTSLNFVLVPAITSTVLMLLPNTFRIGCVMNATILASIAIIFLTKGDFAKFSIELLFVSLPIIMIFVGHPIKYISTIRAKNSID